jgi:hypothetical protein
MRRLGLLHLLRLRSDGPLHPAVAVRRRPRRTPIATVSPMRPTPAPSRPRARRTVAPRPSLRLRLPARMCRRSGDRESGSSGAITGASRSDTSAPPGECSGAAFIESSAPTEGGRRDSAARSAPMSAPRERGCRTAGQWSESPCARDRDACNGRVVRQYFRGKWLLAPRGDSWIAVRLRLRETAGKRVRMRKSECRRSRPKPRPRRRNCQGYSPCLRPGPDVDCRGGSGNGPRYVDGPVYVNGSDPYDLDRDGDGVGCQS